MAVSYPSFEKRLPRAHFARLLESMCARLDAKCEVDVEFRSLYNSKQRMEHLRIQAVWVVGSFARGARDCGDLDLVVQAEGARNVSASMVNREFLGRLPRVRPYLGEPDENSSGVAFSEAKLVWKPSFDWAAAIAAIAEQENAGHFARASDAIPFRREQLHLPFHRLEELLAAHSAGVHTWSFIPLDKLSMCEPRDMAARVLPMCSRDKQRLGPYVQAYLDQVGYRRAPAADYFGTLEPWLAGDTVFAMGRTLPSLHFLDSARYSRIALMPYLDPRGPNGIWVVERGPNHLLNEEPELRAA